LDFIGAVSGSLRSLCRRRPEVFRQKMQNACQRHLRNMGMVQTTLVSKPGFWANTRSWERSDKVSRTQIDAVDSLLSNFASGFAGLPCRPIHRGAREHSTVWALAVTTFNRPLRARLARCAPYVLTSRELRFDHWDVGTRVSQNHGRSGLRTHWGSPKRILLTAI
jgi:hypothetical protein